MAVTIYGSGSITGLSAGGLPDSSVTTSELADSAVTTAKIADANVTGAKLEASGVTAGTYGSSSAIPAITVDAKGRVTSASENAFSASVPIDIQTFNPGGGTIWTKPTTGQTMCRIQMWGGGGGGNRSGDSITAAGGGGAYNEIVVPLSYMNSTATITVGAAGVGRTGSSGAGTAGGASSVTIPNMPTGSLTLFAYGGGAGGAGTSRGTPGGGGGTRSAGGTGTTGAGYSTVDYGSMGDGTMWGGGSLWRCFKLRRRPRLLRIMGWCRWNGWHWRCHQIFVWWSRRQQNNCWSNACWGRRLCRCCKRRWN